MLKEQNFVNDVRSIIEQGRKMAYAAAGQAAITTYWNVGRRIVEEEQAGKVRAEYGKPINTYACRTTDKGIWQWLWSP